MLRAVRMMRQAISPRLAMRRDCIIRNPLVNSLRHCERSEAIQLCRLPVLDCRAAFGGSQ
jgi:hypothetical protein